MESTYREMLYETVNNLSKLREDIFETTLNLAMSNELKEINDVFEEGDVYHFELEHLKGGSDVNVIKLLDIIEHIDSTTESLININALDTEVD
ncbi:MAG: hypothetical protein EA412_08980 [Chitinophagaceae bacterium]|nr:MAG: hypothetical protein EA412_08980 [Chitinophagaceae bacterium]